MKIRVGLSGSTRLVKRLVDAVAAQSDMSLSGVSGWSDLDDLASARAFDVVDSPGQLALICDVLVDVSAATIRILEATDSFDFDKQNRVVAFTSLISGLSPDPDMALFIPGADVLALARVVRAIQNICHVNRLYTTIISRGAHAADAAEVSLDSLTPVVGETELDAQLELVFADVVSICQARRVIAPYTHSHLHMIKLDIKDSVERDAVVAVLQKKSRILVGAARDGFCSTADINEFFRDLGRSRGDRWESFVWEESIMALNQSVYLMLDISPEAVAVPETIDAIRLIGRPQLELVSIRQLTDESLGLLQSITI